MEIKNKKPPALRGVNRRRLRDTILGSVIAAVVLFVIGSGLSSCVRKWFWNYEGPWNGTVVDAETGKAIEGAQVKVEAYYSGFMMGEPCGEKYEFGQTDKEGRFHVNAIHKFAPSQHYALFFMVYKKGYVGFTPYGSVGNAYKADGEKFFKQKNFNIRLVKWADTKFTMKDHVKNISMISCDSFPQIFVDPKLTEQHRTFCREAREEMILACIEKDKNSKYHPFTREQCEYFADRDLGLSQGREFPK